VPLFVLALDVGGAGRDYLDLKLRDMNNKLNRLEHVSPPSSNRSIHVCSRALNIVDQRL
jgi:hypothetical protein